MQVNTAMLAIEIQSRVDVPRRIHVTSAAHKHHGRSICHKCLRDVTIAWYDYKAMTGHKWRDFLCQDDSVVCYKSNPASSAFQLEYDEQTALTGKPVIPERE